MLLDQHCGSALSALWDGTTVKLLPCVQCSSVYLACRHSFGSAQRKSELQGCPCEKSLLGHSLNDSFERFRFSVIKRFNIQLKDYDKCAVSIIQHHRRGVSVEILNPAPFTNKAQSGFLLSSTMQCECPRVSLNSDVLEIDMSALSLTFSQALRHALK